MIRFLILEVVLPLLILLFVRSILRSLFGAFRGNVPQRGTPQAPPVPTGGELKKDPVCGTYVSAAASVTRTVKGEVLHFCSKECRDKY
jgi:hypothetical protein